jgi:subtilase family serine protease
VTAKADANSEVTESNENNNTSTGVSVTIQPPPRPDLIVQSVTVSPASPVEGQSYTITAVVKNQGNATASVFGFDQEVFYYVNGTKVADKSYDDLVAGGTVTLTTGNLTAPAAGNVTVTAKADANSEVTESNENNNTSTGVSVTIQPPPTPDLVVQSVTVSPASPVEGQSYTITAVVKNQGTATASVAFFEQEVFFYVNGTKVAEKGYDDVAAGGTVTLTTGSLTAPAAGNVTVTAKADANSEVTESNENNNTSTGVSVTIQPPPTPDLIVQSVTVSPASPVEGQSYTITAVVKNQGTGTASVFGFDQEVFYYVNGTKVAEKSYDDLVAGGTVTLTTGSMTAPAAGNVTVTAKADANSEVTELNENNNTSTGVSVTIQPTLEPDLIVQSVTVSPASPVEGQSYTITAVVKNQGTGTASVFGFDQEVFYYVNGTKVAEKSYDDLAAGETRTLTTGSLTAPPFGTITVTAKADANGEVTESTENNNTSAGVSVTIQQDINPYGIAELEPAGIGLFATTQSENRTNLTDLAQTKANGLQIDGRPLGATDTKLIVAIHGWNPLAKANHTLIGISSAVAAAAGTDRMGRNWRVLAYDWSRDASTGAVFIPPSSEEPELEPLLPGEDAATDAAERAYQHGLLIGQKILQQVGASNLRAVHLVGHSAGSWAVYAALRYLYAKGPPGLLLQATYLDPYFPGNLNPLSSFKMSLQAASPQFCRVAGADAVNAENYWSAWEGILNPALPDLAFGTNDGHTGSLWTPPSGVVFQTDGSLYGLTHWASHSGPLEFYQATITDPAHPNAGGHGWNHSLAYNDYRTLQLSAASLALGSVTVGSSGTATLRVTNTGRSPLPTLTVTGSGAFTVQPATTTNLQPNAFVDLTVTFAPNAGGAQTGTLTLDGDYSGSPGTVALAGTGVTRSQTLAVNPSANFGSQEVGAFSVRTLVIGNTGNGPLRVAAVQLPSWLSFSTPVPSFPIDIAPSGTANIGVTFQPSSVANFSGEIVVASNKTSGPDRMTVTGTGLPIAPRITHQPASQGIAIGQTATMTVAANGTAPLSYQWFSGESPSVATPISGATTASYTPPAFASSGSFPFWVRVSNASATAALSTTATVTVGPASVAPTITTHPADRAVVSGATVEFTTAASGNPTPAFRWHRRPNGAATSSSLTDGAVSINGATVTITGAESTVLRINGVVAAMTGDRFHCVATNGVVPNAASNEAILTVLSLPMFGSPPISVQPASPVAGQSVTLTANVTGSAPMTYVWRKGGAVVAGATSAVLTLPNFQASDAGVYSVSVSNPLNQPASAEVSVTLTETTAVLAVAASPVVGGTVTGGGTFGIGESREVTATANPGYFFVRWNDGNTSAVRTVVVPAGGVSYTATFEATPVEAGLVAHYKFENDGLDSSGLANHGTANASVTFVPGRSGQAARFNGAAHISVPDHASLDLSTAMTIAAWVRVDTGATTSSRRLIDKNTAGGANGYGVNYHHFGAADPRMEVDLLAAGENGSAPIIAAALNEWVHLAIVVGNGTQILYRNGVEAARGPVAVFATNSLPLVLGAAQDGTLGFQGSMDELRLYNRALSAAEVGSLAAPMDPASLLAHWKFDGDAQDSGPNQLHGTNNGGQFVSDRNGVPNAAIRLRGRDLSSATIGAPVFQNGDYVRVQIRDGRPALGTEFSIAVWVRALTNTSASMVIAAQHGGTSNTQGTWALTQTGSGNLYFNASPTFDGVVSPPGALTTGDWAHVAVTYGAGQWVFYVNGVKVKEGTRTYQELKPLFDLTIGANLNPAIADGIVSHYDGDLDDLRIYAGVLTPGQVASLGASTPTVALSLAANPVAGGTVAGAGTFALGSGAPIAATPAAGYRFVSWTPAEGIAAPTNASTTVAMTQARSLTANFEVITPTYSLTVTPPGNGTVSLNPNKTTFASGESLVLTAAANSGYEFVSWTFTNGTGTSTYTSNPLTTVFTSNATVSATFRIVRQSQTITFPALPDRTYGALPFPVSPTASSGLPVVIEVKSGPAMIAGGIATVTGAGTVTLRATQAGDAAYLAAPPAERSFEVAKAPLTAKAEDKSKVVGAANPPLTISYTGFVNGENKSAITEPTIATTATTSSPVGSYPIALSGGSAANYALSLQNGTLTVTADQVAPSITTPPANRVVGVGAGTTFSVVAAGTGPLTYQWRKDGGAVLANGGRISGATTATLSISDVQLADSGHYTVTVAGAVAPAATSGAGTGVLTVIDARGDHTAAAGYSAGGAVTVSNTLTYAGTATGLAWSVLLPSGWSFATGGGAQGDVKPATGATGLLEWAWTSIPASPVSFTYTLNVPAGTTGEQQLAALLVLRRADLSGAVNVAVRPDPLVVRPTTHHGADTDRNWRLSLVELTRVIELYNTRNGSVRTGAYKVQDAPATEDGFAQDAARAPGASVTLSRYHSADSDRDGRISLVELTRVIELYNYRVGSVRTGDYRVQSGTEDGYAPGPAAGTP